MVVDATSSQSIIFETDKKILNVGSDITELGGTAIDAVKKPPSVQVDYQGNVTIRGNSDFKVLLEVKPIIKTVITITTIIST